MLAREVTRWTVACDRRLHRLICCMHQTAESAQVCFVGDAPGDCWLALFSDASFAGDLRDSKSTSGGILCLVGPNTFVPINWVCTEVPSSPYPRCVECHKPIGQGPECRTSFCGRPVHSNCFCAHLSKCKPCKALRPRPQVRGARLYISKAPKFSTQDIKKSTADAKAPPYQPRNSNFEPHRTDEEGNVYFDDQDTIEQNEEWSRRKALRLREELEPDTDGDSFFVTGSEIRKVYSFKSDPASSNIKLSKSQKRRRGNKKGIKRGVILRKRKIRRRKPDLLRHRALTLAPDATLLVAALLFI